MTDGIAKEVRGAYRCDEVLRLLTLWCVKQGLHFFQSHCKTKLTFSFAFWFRDDEQIFC